MSSRKLSSSPNVVILKGIGKDPGFISKLIAFSEKFS